MREASPSVKMGRAGDAWCMCCPARANVLVIRTGIQETRICKSCWVELTESAAEVIGQSESITEVN